MLAYLLDTHIYVWWRLGSGQLSSEQSKVLDHVEECGEVVGLSEISVWEMAMLSSKGRLSLNNIPLHVWLHKVERDSGISILPMISDVCAESANLPSGLHRNPADQIIVATARVYGLRLITSDERIIRWGKVPLL